MGSLHGWGIYVVAVSWSPIDGDIFARCSLLLLPGLELKCQQREKELGLCLGHGSDSWSRFRMLGGYCWLCSVDLEKGCFLAGLVCLANITIDSHVFTLA